jgi:hypothetical protein
MLQADLNTGVQDLASGMAFNVKNYNTRPWHGLWITGIVNCGLAFINIPFTFAGTKRNGYSFLVTWVCIHPYESQ